MNSDEPSYSRWAVTVVAVEEEHVRLRVTRPDGKTNEMTVAADDMLVLEFADDS